jgi:cyclase
MNAVIAASIFHFGTYTVGDVKRFLQEKNIPVRL